MPSIDIPCTCNNGKPCGKVLRISKLSNGHHLDIEGAGNHLGMIADETGRRMIIEALGGSA